jgi:hypothetical protein
MWRSPPQAALRGTFGETLDWPLAEIVVRNWGVRGKRSANAHHRRARCRRIREHQSNVAGGRGSASNRYRRVK